MFNRSPDPQNPPISQREHRQLRSDLDEALAKIQMLNETLDSSTEYSKLLEIQIIRIKVLLSEVPIAGNKPLTILRRLALMQQIIASIFAVVYEIEVPKGDENANQDPA